MPTTQQAQERVIRVPFGIDETGGVGFTSKAEALAVQEIQSVLLTQKGERVMRPSVGSPFSAQVFSPITSNDTAYIANELMSVLAVCRYSTVQAVRVDLAELGTFRVAVDYVPRSFNVVLTTEVPFSTVFSTGA